MWNQRKDKFRAWMWLCMSRNDIFWNSNKSTGSKGMRLAFAHIKGTTVCILRPSTLEGFKKTDCDTVQQPKKCDDVQDGFQQLNITIRYILLAASSSCCSSLWAFQFISETSDLHHQSSNPQESIMFASDGLVLHAFCAPQF